MTVKCVLNAALSKRHWWLPQATIANLYQITPQAITQHIKAIYEEGELEQNATCKSYLQVKQEGNRQVSRNMPSLQPTRHSCHRLSCPLPRGTQFRQWATQTLQEYLIKGFVMDDERLKNPARRNIGRS
ncbi:Virulence protein [Citrobacter koseri]|uniref:Virulence protein n=1 Tax=Citrobacter koseri TaxID=545 RepID=A0A2X2WIE8_CITKO|nr:Virulence protein [Citrobacter koseri]